MRKIVIGLKSSLLQNYFTFLVRNTHLSGTNEVNNQLDDRIQTESNIYRMA